MIGYAQFNYNPQIPVPFDPACQTGVLPNKIKYMIWPYKVPEGKASFYAFLSIGALQEEPNEYGLAHFMEHLIAGRLQNTKVKDYYNYFTTIGLSEKGDLNAHCGFESTRFDVLNLPVQNAGTLDSALLYLKGALFSPDFDSSGDFEKERGVVIEEWRLKSSERIISEQTEMLALKGTRYARPGVLGDTAALRQLSLMDIKNFYSKWYKPENLTIIAIGDFESARIKTKIEQIFNSIPKSSAISPKVIYPIPDIKEPIINIVTDPEASSHIEIHYKLNRIPGFTQEQLRSEYIDKLINHMLNNRFNKIANEPNPPFTMARASFNHSYFSSADYNEYAFEITAVKDPKLALKAILTENERIVKYGFTETELKKAKDFISGFFKSNILNELPSSEIFMKCYSYLEWGIVPASNDYLKKFIYAVFPDITLNEIKERYRKCISKVKPVISIQCTEKKDISLPVIYDVKNMINSISKQKIEPYTDKKEIINEKALFDKPGIPGKVTKQTTNTKVGTTEWILSNGLRVVIKTTDFNKDEIQFAGLRVPDTSKYNKEYLAVSTDPPYSIKSTGIGGFSAAQLNQILSGKKILIEYICSTEKQGIQGNFSSADFETALQLINLSFSDQSWTAKDTIWRGVMMTGLDNSLTTVFKDSINKYSSNINLKDWKIVPLERLNKVYKRVFSNPKEFTFLFSGNLQPEKAKFMIEKYLGSLNSNFEQESENKILVQNQMSAINPEWWKTGKKTCEFKYPMKTKKAVIFICSQGKFIPSPTNSIYCDIAQRLLSEQIENTIREKYGATYMVGSSGNIVNPDFAQFSISFSVDPSTADQMKIIAHDEMKKFMEEGAKGDEFNIRKNKVIKQETDKLLSNKWWVNSVMFEFYFHQRNIVPTYVEDVSNISLEGLREFTRNIYQQGNIIDVVMKPQ